LGLYATEWLHLRGSPLVGRGSGITPTATRAGNRALIQSAPASLRGGAACALVLRPSLVTFGETAGRVTAARQCHTVRSDAFDLGFVPARRLGGQTGDGRAPGR